jgi:hypothetical protein
MAVPLSMAVELLEGWVDAMAANRVCCGTLSALVAALSYLPELEPVLELLRSGCNMDLTEDQVDALWARVCATSDPLASHVPPSVTHNPFDGAGEY